MLQRTNHGSVNIGLNEHRGNVRIAATNSEIVRHVAQCANCSLGYMECVVIDGKRND